MDNSKIKIRGSIKDWRKPWIVGVICLIAYLGFKIDYYHFYLYFFLAGIMTVIFEFRGWGEIGSDGLLVRFGLLGLKSVFFRWDEINKIKPFDLKEKLFIRFGGGMTLPTDDQYTITTIGIELTGTLSDDRAKYFNKLRRKYIFGQELNVLEDNKTVLLHREPVYGLNYFLDLVSKYVTVESSEGSHITNGKEKRYHAFSMLDFLIFALPIAVYIAFDMIS
jgi:hypothetical protein